MRGGRRPFWKSNPGRKGSDGSQQLKFRVSFPHCPETPSPPQSRAPRAPPAPSETELQAASYCTSPHSWCQL